MTSSLKRQAAVQRSVEDEVRANASRQPALVASPSSPQAVSTEGVDQAQEEVPPFTAPELTRYLNDPEHRARLDAEVQQMRDQIHATIVAGTAAWRARRAEQRRKSNA